MTFDNAADVENIPPWHFTIKVLMYKCTHSSNSKLLRLFILEVPQVLVQIRFLPPSLSPFHKFLGTSSLQSIVKDGQQWIPQQHAYIHEAVEKYIQRVFSERLFRLARIKKESSSFHTYIIIFLVWFILCCRKKKG